MKEFLNMIGGLITALIVVAVIGYGTFIALDFIIVDSGCVGKATRHSWMKDYTTKNSFYCYKCLTVKELVQKTGEVSMTAEVTLTTEVKIK